MWDLISVVPGHCLFSYIFLAGPRSAIGRATDS